MLPVTAALAFEVIRLAGKYRHVKLAAVDRGARPADAAADDPRAGPLDGRGGGAVAAGVMGAARRLARRWSVGSASRRRRLEP